MLLQVQSVAETESAAGGTGESPQGGTGENAAAKRKTWNSGNRV